MNINWYPGHMKKTIESIEQSLKLVDFVIVLLDARIPWSSKNPLLDKVIGNKPVLYLLNKADLADDKTTKEWIRSIEENENAVAMEWISVGKTNTKKLIQKAEELLKEKRQKELEKGMAATKLRAMVTGIPNVGKSTFINQISGRKGTKTGNRPGVTKTNQWMRVGELDLLDTPGVLWPKLDPPIRGRHLAFTGSIKDEIMDIETLAFEFIKEAMKNFPEKLYNRYEIQNPLEDPVEIMDAIGKRRGALMRGAEIDYTKVSHIVMDEFRGGQMGRISLEVPLNYEFSES
ncbi:ribosome biogenesis GTPase YlqF [Peptoniphilus sp. KCTC 25270]|uniref:ribosome biogenesis GTPase YlqF n=1 Tax=Peptoniphilus sp. KCTC 25270 TaxID=2897414 RepID=UPI001E37C9E5|nr:ribosome biogenesis GTPase YlqF [Peptoniphilus sp. KCTC 25270]MCD1147084.1 ribosome biogenesis GTPase YlqF [Peptoniphilus sp. KCTC 25270]